MDTQGSKDAKPRADKLPSEKSVKSVNLKQRIESRSNVTHKLKSNEQSSVADMDHDTGSIEILQNRNRRLEEQRMLLQRDKEQSMKTIENLLNQNQDLISENASLRDQLHKESKALEQVQMKLHMTEEKVRKLKDENRILTENNLKVTTEMESLRQQESEVRSLYRTQQNDINRLLKEKDKESSRLQDATNRFVKLKNENLSLTQEKINLEKEVKTQQSTIIELQIEIERLRNPIAAKKPDEKKTARRRLSTVYTN